MNDQKKLERQIQALERQIQALAETVDKIVAGLAETNSRIDERLTETNSRIDETNGRLDELTSIFIESIKEQYANNKIIDNNFAKLNQKIDKLDDRVSKHHGDTNKNFEEVKLETNKNFKDVKLELVKLQKTTGYEELYQNLLKVNK